VFFFGFVKVVQNVRSHWGSKFVIPPISSYRNEDTQKFDWELSTEDILFVSRKFVSKNRWHWQFAKMKRQRDLSHKLFRLVNFFLEIISSQGTAIRSHKPKPRFTSSTKSLPGPNSSPDLSSRSSWIAKTVAAPHFRVRVPFIPILPRPLDLPRRGTRGPGAIVDLAHIPTVW